MPLDPTTKKPAVIANTPAMSEQPAPTETAVEDNSSPIDHYDNTPTVQQTVGQITSGIKDGLTQRLSPPFTLDFTDVAALAVALDDMSGDKLNPVAKKTTWASIRFLFSHTQKGIGLDQFKIDFKSTKKGDYLPHFSDRGLKLLFVYNAGLFHQTSDIDILFKGVLDHPEGLMLFSKNDLRIILNRILVYPETYKTHQSALITAFTALHQQLDPIVADDFSLILKTASALNLDPEMLSPVWDKITLYSQEDHAKLLLPLIHSQDVLEGVFPFERFTHAFSDPVVQKALKGYGGNKIAKSKEPFFASVLDHAFILEAFPKETLRTILQDVIATPQVYASQIAGIQAVFAAFDKPHQLVSAKDIALILKIATVLKMDPDLLNPVWTVVASYPEHEQATLIAELIRLRVSFETYFPFDLFQNSFLTPKVQRELRSFGGKKKPLFISDWDKRNYLPHFSDTGLYGLFRMAPDIFFQADININRLFVDVVQSDGPFTLFSESDKSIILRRILFIRETAKEKEHYTPFQFQNCTAFLKSLSLEQRSFLFQKMTEKYFKNHKPESLENVIAVLQTTPQEEIPVLIPCLLNGLIPQPYSIQFRVFEEPMVLSLIPEDIKKTLADFYKNMVLNPEAKVLPESQYFLSLFNLFSDKAIFDLDEIEKLFDLPYLDLNNFPDMKSFLSSLSILCRKYLCVANPKSYFENHSPDVSIKILLQHPDILKKLPIKDIDLLVNHILDKYWLYQESTEIELEGLSTLFFYHCPKLDDKTRYKLFINLPLHFKHLDIFRVVLTKYFSGLPFKDQLALLKHDFIFEVLDHSSNQDIIEKFYKEILKECARIHDSKGYYGSEEIQHAFICGRHDWGNELLAFLIRFRFKNGVFPFLKIDKPFYNLYEIDLLTHLGYSRDSGICLGDSQYLKNIGNNKLNLQDLYVFLSSEWSNKTDNNQGISSVAEKREPSDAPDTIANPGKSTTVSILLAGLTYFMGFIGSPQESKATEPVILTHPDTTLILPANNANDIVPADENLVLTTVSEEELSQAEESSAPVLPNPDVDGKNVLANGFVPLNVGTGFTTSGGLLAMGK